MSLLFVIRARLRSFDLCLLPVLSGKDCSTTGGLKYFPERIGVLLGKYWEEVKKKAETREFPLQSLLCFTFVSYFSTELHGFLLPPCMPARVSCRASWASCFLLHPYYYLLCLLVKIDVQISELYGGIVLGER